MKALTENEVRAVRPGGYISVDGRLYVKLKQSRWISLLDGQKLKAFDVYRLASRGSIVSADPLQVLAAAKPMSHSGNT